MEEWNDGVGKHFKYILHVIKSEVLEAVELHAKQVAAVAVKHEVAGA